MTATGAIKVKISGDGARNKNYIIMSFSILQKEEELTRNSNYIIMSFSILQKEEELMSSRGTCTAISN